MQLELSCGMLKSGGVVALGSVLGRAHVGLGT
jgi:hypothetical protein